MACNKHVMLLSIHIRPYLYSHWMYVLIAASNYLKTTDGVWKMEQAAGEFLEEWRILFFCSYNVFIIVKLLLHQSTVTLLVPAVNNNEIVLHGQY